MNEQRKNNGRGIFYGVIGVATLVVAIIGATFAYFTATGNDNSTIHGNMASITFSLSVTKVTHVDESKGGMIPMSNNMVEAAVSNAQTCVDNNSNAVCQIYKIDVSNTGSASLFVDGYVALSGGSGESADVPAATTTMRWAQVFCSGSQTDEITGCTTAGTSTTGATGLSPATMPAIGRAATVGDTADERFNKPNILSTFAEVIGQGTIAGNSYDIINVNYIRTSQHTGATFDRNADVTSALVYNQNLTPAGSQSGSSQTMYIVVWLSENGHNQTAGSGGTNVPDTPLNFFSGQVVFNSAQGSEVTATFTGYTAVQSDKASVAQNNEPEQEPTGG